MEGRLLADKGESLKTYCETKWTSIYETTSSVLRLQAALETGLLNNPNDITSWLYGKRRQRLGLSRVEAMAKIRSFYISNIRAELVYASQKYIVDELHEMVNDSVFLQFENVDETHENETILEPLEIPNHEVQVLIIEKFIDLKKTVRELDDENSDTSASDSEIDSSSVDDNYSNDDSSNENDENDNLEVETDGYNIEELTNKYLLDNEDTL
uniref:Uncharacterized protein n=1 Tax=Rhizophagus irregularis (strain DAOM 181602 / DAOM 197198 / MUCL 43194) TaxID=747089 RepID=U9USV4_RHIID